jgi:hypothetical protein
MSTGKSIEIHGEVFLATVILFFICIVGGAFYAGGYSLNGFL